MFNFEAGKEYISFQSHELKVEEKKVLKENESAIPGREGLWTCKNIRQTLSEPPKPGPVLDTGANCEQETEDLASLGLQWFREHQLNKYTDEETEAYRDNSLS